MPESDRWTLLGMVVPKTDMNRRWDGFQVPKTKYSNLFQSTKRLHKNSGDTKIIQNHYQFPLTNADHGLHWPRAHSRWALATSSNHLALVASHGIVRKKSTGTSQENDGQMMKTGMGTWLTNFGTCRNHAEEENNQPILILSSTRLIEYDRVTQHQRCCEFLSKARPVGWTKSMRLRRSGWCSSPEAWYQICHTLPSYV